MKNLIIIFFFTAILPAVSANAQQIPDWAYNAADKLIKSNLLADKSITRDKLAAFLADEDNAESNGKKEDELSESEKIQQIARILAREKDLSLERNSANLKFDLPLVQTIPDKNTSVFRSGDPVKLPRSDAASAGAPLPALYERFNESAPYWIYDIFTQLNNAGLISPDDAVTLESHNLNRREGAILTARAYNYYRQNNPYIYNQLSGSQTNTNTFLYEDIKKLMQEFSVEIAALGYNAGRDASTERPARSIDKSLKIRGEIRYNIINNSSSNPRYNWNDHRIRTRIYMDKPLDDTWTIHGMLESDKSFSHSNNNRYYTNAKDGKVSLDRYYISGSTNLFNLPVDVEAGATSAYLGDGNILDSDFKGVKISTFGANSADKSTLYSAGYGKVNDTENMFYAEAYHKTSRDIDYTAGIYR